MHVMGYNCLFLLVDFNNLSDVNGLTGLFCLKPGPEYGVLVR